MSNLCLNSKSRTPLGYPAIASHDECVLHYFGTGGQITGATPGASALT